MWTVIATITGIATLLYMICRDKKSNNEKRQQEVKEHRNRMANPGSPADSLAVLEEESPSVFAPELKVPRKPKDLVSRIEEEGRCFFRWGGKEYDTDKSTLVYGDKDGITTTIYRTSSGTFFVVMHKKFAGERSEEEILEYLDTNNAPKEAYERAGIKLESA